jgi:tetratricopeptide (TPR) repeat protein
MSDEIPTWPLPPGGQAPSHAARDTIGESPAAVRPGPPAAAGSAFTLLAELARGGMGIVYRSRDESLGREVAVKTLQRQPAPGSQVARRFLDEARITGQLQHPGIPPVYQSGTLPDGRPFLAMKLIKGSTLEAIVRDRPDPAGAEGAGHRGRLLAAFEQVCQAVGYAHSRGVIHRDLKPSNVMVGGFGEVQVMDWGLAKVLGSRADQPGVEPDAAVTAVSTERDGDQATRAGTVLGTPAYMPPEQAIGAVDQVDERSDVFGLGAVLAVILTGKPPFVGENAESTRQLAARGQVGDCFARLDACGADPGWVKLCKRCLAAEKTERPVDATEVAAAAAELRTAADERARQAELDRVRADGERAKAETEARELRKRRRVQLALAGATFLLAAGGGAFAWYADRKATAERTERERREALTEREVGVALGEMAVLCDRGEREAENPPRWRLTLDAGRSAYRRADAAVKAGPASAALAEQVRVAGERLARDEFDCETARLYEAWADSLGKAMWATDPAVSLPPLFRQAEVLVARIAGPPELATGERAAALRGHRLRYTGTVVVLFVDLLRKNLTNDRGRFAELARSLASETHPLQTDIRRALEDGSIRAFLAGPRGRALTGRELICLVLGQAEDPNGAGKVNALADEALARNPADLTATLLFLGRTSGGTFLRPDPKTGITRIQYRNTKPRSFLDGELRRLGAAEAASALRPDLGAAWASAGDSLASAGYYSPAADRYSEAVRRAPADPDLRVRLTESLDAAGRRAEAVHAYREALEAFPQLRARTKSPFADTGTMGTPFRLAAARAALALAHDAGAEAARPTADGRRQLRRDALRWLGEWLAEGPPTSLDLFLLSRDPAFRLVRDPELQNHLADDEQQEWRGLAEKVRTARPGDRVRYLMVGESVGPEKPPPPAVAPPPRQMKRP